MPTRKSVKTDTYYKCKKCGDEIFWNTRKEYISCTCGKLAVDGCEYYVRLMGREEDREMVTRPSGGDPSLLRHRSA